MPAQVYPGQRNKCRNVEKNKIARGPRNQKNAHREGKKHRCVIAGEGIPVIQSTTLRRRQANQQGKSERLVCDGTWLVGSQIVYEPCHKQGKQTSCKGNNDNLSCSIWGIPVPEPEVPEQAHDGKTLEYVCPGNITDRPVEIG